MDLELKYGEMYKVNLKGEEYKGLYLGKRAPRIRLKSLHSILIDRPSSLLWGFSLIGFNKYSFEDNKLILKAVYDINPSSRQKGNIEKLFKTKLNLE
ncbi:MAG: hypothetical protein AABY32_00285 [Nanoarchaeota archaeon]